MLCGDFKCRKARFLYHESSWIIDIHTEIQNTHSNGSENHGGVALKTYVQANN